MAEVLLPGRELGGNEKGSCSPYGAESLFSEAGLRGMTPITAASEMLITNVKANFANKGFFGENVLFSTAGKEANTLGN